MVTIAREGLEDKYSLQLAPGEGGGAREANGERARLPKVRGVRVGCVVVCVYVCVCGVCGGVCVCLCLWSQTWPVI